jgi:type I restriction enzyme M protein
MWWLRPELQTDDKKKKVKLKKEIFGKEGYKDPYGRLGRGTGFPAPPAGYGDYAFILHILASLTADGRAGIVCPQGVLFRGQPEHTSDDEPANGSRPKTRNRKADDEYLIREALVNARVIDAVVSLPLNIFYGAGLPACLVLLRKERPAERQDKMLLLYAARHYRELSAQNELRPQDVMRILVHYHAYGDAAKVPPLLTEHRERIHAQIDNRERDEVDLILAEYEAATASLIELDNELERLVCPDATAGSAKRSTSGSAKVSKQREKVAEKIAERDLRIAEARRRATEDRADVEKAAAELTELYADPDQLVKHARVVSLTEIQENEFNLNIPRYVDTFEPEPYLDVTDALKAFVEASAAAQATADTLAFLLADAGYATD